MIKMKDRVMSLPIASNLLSIALALESTPRDDDTDDFGNENVGSCCLSLSGLHVQAVSNHFLQPEKAKQNFF
jgi:hypothetical protein